MATPDIGVIFPSRGLCFSETINELLDELKGIKHTIYWSHGNSLPDCFNIPLERALNASHSHIWIVEDDMVLPRGVLHQMLDTDSPIVATDYPVSDQPNSSTSYDNHDRPIYTGTGCILIKREVLEAMPKPIFRADIQWNITNINNQTIFIPEFTDKDKVYGHQDINFGIYHYINGTDIKVLDTTLGQRRLVRKGTRDNNQGQDVIEILNKYKKQYASDYPSKAEDTGNLKKVIIDGKEILLSKETYNKLKTKIDIQEPEIRIKDLVIRTSNKDIKSYFNLF